MTRDEIIKGLENEISRIHREPKGKMLGIFMTVDEAEDIVTLLKEQESEEKRILKIVWDILHNGVSTDTEADQDWVYEQIRNQVHQVYYLEACHNCAHSFETTDMFGYEILVCNKDKEQQRHVPDIAFCEEWRRRK